MTSFQHHLRNWILILVIISGVVLGVVLVFYRLGGYFAMVQDSKEFSCEQLPSWNQAQKIFQEHSDTIEQIENISPGMVFIALEERCSGRGEVVIYYDTIQTRNQIKALIGDSFFGIPYVMYNV